MKKLLVLTLLSMFAVINLKASVYYSINIDEKTIAEMGALYAELEAQEVINSDYEEKVMKHYAEATGYSTIILGEKKLMYNSLVNPGDLAEQNCQYYEAIYSLVKDAIIPKTLSVLNLCIKDPKQAIWWGSRIHTIMSETENLCHQYQSVVTNGKLKFNDVPFLKFKQEYADLMELAKAQQIDWKSRLNGVFSESFQDTDSEDSLEVSYKSIPKVLMNLASSGANAYNSVLEYAPYYAKFKNNISQIQSMIGCFQDIDSFESGVCNTIGALSSVAQLVETSTYSEDGWINSFNTDYSETDFTQKAEIVYHDYGTDTIAWYDPPTWVEKVPDGTLKNSVLEDYLRQDVDANPDWLCLVSGLNCTDKSVGYDISTEERAQMQEYSEKRIGYSKTKFYEEKENNPQYSYYFNEDIRTKQLVFTRTSDQVRLYPFKAGAAYLHCWRTHNWYTTLETLEYDSDTEDYSSFQQRVELALKQAKAKSREGEYDYEAHDASTPDKIDGTTSERNPYYGLNENNIIVRYGEKIPYQHTSANQLAGATKATFKVTCHGEYDLNKGKFTHMCEHGATSWFHQGTAGWDHCDDDVRTIQECIFDDVTEIDDPVDPTIDDSIAVYTDKIETLETQRKAVSDEQDALDINTQRERYVELQTEYNSLTAEINRCNSILAEYQKNKQEQENEKFNQIGSLKSDNLADVLELLGRTYKITWENAYDDPSNFVYKGDCLEYTRYGHSDTHEGSMVFTARLSFDEPGFAAKWVKIFGAKIFMRRRARALCEYHLKAYTTEENVIEEMDVDGKSKEEAAKLVEERRKELQKNYDPDSCQVTVQLAYKDSQNDSIEDVEHMMYPADRLDIAQDIYWRLRNIYIELVYVEKFLQYKMSWGQFLRGYFPYVRNDETRKNSIASVCLRRWMKNGGAEGYNDY